MLFFLSIFIIRSILFCKFCRNTNFLKTRFFSLFSQRNFFYISFLTCNSRAISDNSMSLIMKIFYSIRIICFSIFFITILRYCSRICFFNNSSIPLFYHSSVYFIYNSGICNSTLSWLSICRLIFCGTRRQN